jgi:hypothetical protein
MEVPLDMTVIVDGVVRFLTGNFPYSGELQCIWMAIQGAMAIRTGVNKNGNLRWFHAFALSVMAGFAGSVSVDVPLAGDISSFFCDVYPTRSLMLITTSLSRLFFNSTVVWLLVDGTTQLDAVERFEHGQLYHRIHLDQLHTV